MDYREPPVNDLKGEFIPALKYHTLTRIYDPLLRWTMREVTFKSHLIQQARVAPQQKVLDLGCGTGTLTVMIKNAHPEADVVGIDADEKVLAIGRRKAAQRRLELAFYRGMAFDILYPSKHFDRVFSSLLLHHLSQHDKLRTLREVFRVLQPGGELHMADWGKPRTVLTKAGFLLVRALDGFENTNDNAHGLLPELFRQAGFQNVSETGRYPTLFGNLCLYRAVRC